MFSVLRQKKTPLRDTDLTILVVCTGNICRSPMAAYLLQHSLPQALRQRVAVASAGTYALHGNRAADFAVQAMSEAGIDIRSHRARQLTSTMIRQAGLIVAMEKSHVNTILRLSLWRKPSVFLLGSYGAAPEKPEIEDPYGAPLETYRACLRVIQPCINGLINQLTADPPRLAPPDP